MANTSALPTRDQVQADDTWKLEDIFATDEAWDQEYEQVKELLNEAKNFQGTFQNGPDAVFEALTYQDEVTQRMGKLYVYSHMRYDQDTTNGAYQRMDDRAKGLYTQVASSFSYVEPELLSLSEETLKRYTKEHAGLHLYAKQFERLNKQRPHILDADKEALLAQANEIFQASGNTFSMLNNADLEFPTIKDENGEEVSLTHGRYTRFLESSDRRVRKDAFEAMYNTYGGFRNTFASTLSGNVKKNNFSASVRSYSSARQAALSTNEIPETVYDNLVKTVNDNLDLLHRYVNLRKKVLGVDELHMYDLYTPLVKDVDMKVSYEEAKAYLQKGLAPLGEEYLGVLNEGFQNRWVDVHENKGKRSGAYSSGTYGTNPYILMNWQDNVNNLFTLAHEFGHSVHSYYTRKTQPYPYGNYSIFVAEVASTCNEALLQDYMLKNIDDERKQLYLVNHYLEGFRGTVFRQTMFAEFEHMIHQKAQEGEALTAEALTHMYYALNEKYFGKNNMHIDESIGLEWARIPHFYMGYYVYQYATGFSAAAALSQQILQEGGPAVDRYLKFLQAGSSEGPIDVLRSAGVDMTSPKPIEQACGLFRENLEKMEQLLS